MTQSRRSFRLVIQRVEGDWHPSFRVIAYGEAGANAHAEFATARALFDALETAVPNVVLDLHAQGSIVFAGVVELDDTQLRSLGLG